MRPLQTLLRCSPCCLIARLVVLVALGIGIAGLGLVCGARLNAQSLPPADAAAQERGILEVLHTQEAAWNRGDLDRFAQGYKNSPETLFLSSGVSRGYAGMIARYHEHYPTRESMGTLRFSGLEVHPLDARFAVCIGRFHLERTAKGGGNADGIFSLVFEKTDAGWKIVVDHTS